MPPQTRHRSGTQKKCIHIYIYACIHFFKVLASRTMKISEGILANQPSLTLASGGCEG